MSAIINRLRAKIQGLPLPYTTHIEFEELVSALEREYVQLLQKVNKLEQEVRLLKRGEGKEAE